MLSKKIITFIVAALISSITFAQANENKEWFRLVSVNNNQAEFEKIWQASQSRMNNVHKATIQGKEVIVSGPFTYQKAQEMQKQFIEKGINNVKFLSKEQLVITQSGGKSSENNQNNLTSQNQVPQQSSVTNNQNVAEITKLKKLWIGHWSGSPEKCVEGEGLFIESGENGNLKGRFMVKNHAGKVLENSKSTYKNFRHGNNSILIFDQDITFFNGSKESRFDNQINIAKTEFIFMVSGAAKYINCSNPNTKAQGTQNIQKSIAQDRLIFGLIDDLNTGLIDQSSAARRLASCIGVMKGAQFAANSISQQNLSIALFQQEGAFHSYFGSNKFPPVNTIERMMLDGALRDAQSGAEGLSRNNQQGLVFRVANNCKGALGAALKN